MEHTNTMPEFDEKLIDQATLALLHIVAFKDGPNTRAWKGFDWDSLNRLHNEGFISEPRGKTKSVALTPEGSARAESLAREMFSQS